MNNKLIQSILSCSALGLAFSMHLQPVEAAVIGSETSDTLSFSFDGVDAYPSGNSPFANSPLVTLFDGQYWQVSAQSLAAPTGPAVGISRLYVQQVIPGQALVPSAVFGLSLRNFSPYTQQISYPASSIATTFNTVNCPLASDNCVFYELQAFSTPNTNSSSLRYDLQGFFQASDSPTAVPESPTVVGSLVALGVIIILRNRKRFAQHNIDAR
jgi:hypothetical protein